MLKTQPFLLNVKMTMTKMRDPPMGKKFRFKIRPKHDAFHVYRY